MRVFAFCISFLLACGATPPTVEEVIWEKLTIAVPKGWRSAVSGTGARPRILEYSAGRIPSADIVVTFDTAPAGYSFAGAWLIEIPALAMRSDLGDFDSAAIITSLREMAGDEGAPRLAYDPRFIPPPNDIREVTIPIATSAPLDMLLKKTAEAAILDGAEQAALAIVETHMRDRIHLHRFSDVHRVLSLWVRPGAEDAAAYLVSSAVRLESIGYIAAE